MSARATVIIVSQGRPKSLTVTLDALCFQNCTEFEVLVVGGTLEEAALRSSDFADKVGYVAFDAQNISAARNAGIAAASGEVITFIDDDAVPGPGWLCLLVSALDETSADLAAGHVRGPDGIGFQFRGALLRADAFHDPLEPSDKRRVIEAPEGRAVEAMGTNAAYTREALERLGGFDPAYAYFLDESDLNWRLARAGARAVIVPRAQVVHSMAASHQRSVERVPLTLLDIGRSTRAFLDRHFDGDAAEALGRHRTRHAERLARHVRAGRLAPARVPEILQTFDTGAAIGPAVGGWDQPDAEPAQSWPTMRGRGTETRVERHATWFARETLSYSGGGTWSWHKPRLGRPSEHDSRAGVSDFLNS